MVKLLRHAHIEGEAASACSDPLQKHDSSLRRARIQVTPSLSFVSGNTSAGTQSPWCCAPISASQASVATFLPTSVATLYEVGYHFKGPDLDGGDQSSSKGMPHRASTPAHFRGPLDGEPPRPFPTGGRPRTRARATLTPG